MRKTQKRYTLPALILSAALLLCACGGTNSTDVTLRLFYPVPARQSGGGDVVTSVQVDWTRQAQLMPAQQLEILAQRLLKSSGGQEDYRSPMPSGTQLLSCDIVGSTARLDFSAAYGLLSGMELTVADYCLTLSASQIPGVRQVEITVNGANLPGRSRSVFTTDDVLLTSSEDVVKTVTVTLYFPDQSGTLQPESRDLLLYGGESRAGRIVDSLLAGPVSDGLLPLLPAGLPRPDVRVEDEICYLNFTYAAFQQLRAGEVAPETVVQGLVQTLCAADGVEQLQLLAEGAYQAQLGTADISKPLSPAE